MHHFPNGRAIGLLFSGLAAFALSCVAHPAHAQENSAPLSLDEAVSLGLLSAPQVSAPLSELEGMQAAAVSAGRLPDPELIAALDNVPTTTDERFSLTRDFMTMQRVGVMQSFPNRQKRRLQNERAQRGVAVAAAQLRKARFETARAIADAWVSRAVAERSLEQLRTLMPEAVVQEAASRAALAGGRTSAADALKAQALVARIEDRILAFEQDAQSRKAELARWVGTAADRPLTAIPADREIAHSAEALVSAVPEHAPLAPIHAQLAATQTDVALARAQKRPDWSAELGYANRGPDFSDMVSLEVRVQLPLFPGRRQDPLIAQQLAMVRAQESEREAELRMHISEVQSMFAHYRIGRQRLERYETELLPLARDRFRVASSSYRAGRGSFESLFDALSEEIDDELAYIELQGVVARAWTFLHLLHDFSGTSGAEAGDAR
jgi:cobalt-zinc-cadmium efflux system outer membrane protein